MTQLDTCETTKGSTSSDASSRSDAGAFVGSIPAIYDAHLGPHLFDFSGADLARRAAEGLPEGGRLLEVACGTGISTEHLRRALPKTTEIVATDLNSAMLDFARQTRGALPGVSWQEADAMELPFDDNTFDAVVCQFGIMFFPDKARGLSEMSRVFKPGGAMLLNTWDSFSHNPCVRIAHDVIARFCAGDPPQFLTVPFGDFNTELVRERLADVGLTDIEIAVVSEDVHCVKPRSLAKGLIEGNPGVAEIRTRSRASTDEIVEAVTAEYHAVFGEGPTTIPMQEIVFRGRKAR